MITDAQLEKITPLLQKVVDSLDIKFGEIRAIVHNGVVYRIIPSDDILTSKKEDKIQK